MERVGGLMWASAEERKKGFQKEKDGAVSQHNNPRDRPPARALHQARMKDTRCNLGQDVKA